MANDDKAFETISFTDLVRRTLLDQFEFGAHSFDGVDGQYFLNSIGIDFESPIPKEDIKNHAISVDAKTIYLAHTHPLSNDYSFKFLNAKKKTREKRLRVEIHLCRSAICHHQVMCHFSVN